jgi:opacity protein-like surface antigen
MKRWCILCAALICGAIAAANAEGAVISFRVGTGYSYIGYGDYNDRVDYMNGEYLPSMSIAGTLDEFHWMPEISGEILVPFLSRFELGVGLAWMSGSKAFSIEPVGYRYEHTVRAYPVTATVYANLPAPVPFATPYLFAGGGAYYSKVSFDYETPQVATSFEGELSTWDFGVHAGAGVRFAVAPRMSFDVAIKGRLAAIQGFEGTKTWGRGETEDIFLAAGADQQGNVIFDPKPVSEASAFDEGTVNLSGVAITLGLRIVF